MNDPRPEMACQQCHAPLNTLGDPRHPTYLHPLALDLNDHEPIPVPASQLDTIARRCDFCGDQYPLWTLLGSEVAAVAVSDEGGLWQNFGARWAACATCEHLADTGRTSALVDRAAAAVGIGDIAVGRQGIAKLHSAFLRGRRPGRALITTTGWPATTLRPIDLPKIRDRLARLYKGTDHLPEPLHSAERRLVNADSLDRARLYWIDLDFTDLAEHATAQLPDATLATEDLPAADGLLVWTRPITSREIAAASWTTNLDGLLITCYRQIGGGLDSTTLQRVREQVGWLAPTTAVAVAVGGLLPAGGPASALAATGLLIAQQLAETVPADLDRATRKTYARQQRPTPDVRVVRIKARPRARTAAAGTAAAAGRKPLQEREWVGEHWKQQAFGPGRSQRKLIYVAPYLRGPEDKPIRASTTVRVLGTGRKSSKPSSDQPM